MSKKLNKILIVEDEQFLLEVLSDTLVAEGYQVFPAKDGVEGLKLASRVKPDLILLDVVMPKMNGLTMLKKVRACVWGKKIPVIVLTNVSDPRHVIDAVEFDRLDPASSEPKPVVSDQQKRCVKCYLDARFPAGVSEYLIKSNLKIEEVIQKVRNILAN